ncbi:MAG: cytochrome c oxidase subunit 3 [Gammaproteobacteria bacterium]
MAHGSSGGHQTYYVPESSKYPVLATIGLGTAIVGASLTLIHTKNDTGGMSWLLPAGFVFFICVLWNWFGTTIRENLAGLNSPQLKKSYVMGMQWFIFSEVMFFFAFFFALAYVRIFAVPWLGGEGDHGLANQLWQGFEASWPLMQTPSQAVATAGGQAVMSGAFQGPEQVVGWAGIPLLNTALLVTSSVTVHFAHSALKGNNRAGLRNWLIITLLLGFTFVGFQAYEYHHAYTELGLTLASGIYGSTFFLLTGFHGFHVCLGAVMLTVMFLRSQKGQFTPEDHFGFEAASWYWHFVDVVWIALFLFVYIL